MDNPILAAVVISLLAVALIYTVYIIGGLIVAPIVMIAWNASMPYIFGLPHIGYWHAFWLWIVSVFVWKPVQANNSNGNK